MHVTDLSWGGCFVATIVPAEAGAHVTLRAKVAGVDVLLTGCVVHVKPERGFAVEFVNLSSDTRAHLDHFFAQALTTLA